MWIHRFSIISSKTLINDILCKEDMIVLTLKDEVEDSTLVGGKAYHLMKMKTFTVPPGNIITTEAYALFCKKTGIEPTIEGALQSVDFEDMQSVRNMSEKIRKAFLRAEIPEELSAIFQSLPYEHMIVRSSADLEDLPEASFAGQQETIFNPPDIEKAVKQCWASLWTERAIAYRHGHSMETIPKMALLIQEAIPCHVSGVIFTQNPVTNDQEMIVEAVFGMGESLVSGEVTPDQYVLDRHGQIQEQIINHQEKKLILSPEGICYTGCEEGACLSSHQLRELGETALKIEQLFGCPQDIEFGIWNDTLYIFQSRDITSRQEDIWTRGYSDDYWTGVTSPLYFSLLGEFLDTYVNKEGNAIMGYTELEGVNLLRYHKAHVYFNTRVLREVFKYNPKFSRVRQLLDYFPPHQRQEMKELPFNLLKRLLAELRIAVHDWDGLLFNTYKKYDTFSENYLQQLKAFDTLSLETLTDDQLMEQFHYLYTICLKHYRLVRWGIATHNMGMNMILKNFITQWYGRDPDTTYSILVSGLPPNKATETNEALFRLVSVKIQDESRFQTELQQFLDEYGHRSYSRDVIFPTWAEQPEIIENMVQSLMDTQRDATALEVQKREEREILTREVMETIGKQRYGFIKKHIFKLILGYAQKYIAFRENQRFFLDHQDYRFRKLFLEIGRRLKERIILKERDDVFFLFKEEVFDALTTRKIDYQKIENRKNEFHTHEFSLPPKFLQGNREFDEHFSYEKECTGVPSSPGIVEGTVKIIKTIHELHTIEQGEILVATSTDPGWTPVFLKIKGLITETGGVLSHGAVVSREYGIPAVTGVKQAMQFLHDGDNVVVDGTAGKVYVR